MPWRARTKAFVISALAASEMLSGCAPRDERAAERRAIAERPAKLGATTHPETQAALDELRGEETELRTRTDFAALSPSSRAFGANPYALARVGERAGRERFAGVLRGDSALVLLDAHGRELSRTKTVLSPNSIAATGEGRLFVAGDIEPRIARYRLEGTRFVREEDVSIPEATTLRAVVADERAVFAADFARDRLYVAWPEPSGTLALASRSLCRGPIRLALTEHFLGALCLFDHAIAIFARDAHGGVLEEIKRIAHDGPVWGFSLLERGNELLVAAGGVEDRPLDRRDKAFGYVDSFAYLYRLSAARHVERSFALNTSELGVVTPKVARLAATERGVGLTLVGYASDVQLDVEWSEPFAWNDPGGPRVLATRHGVPGCSDAAASRETLLCANPLFDAWVELASKPGVEVPVIRPVRPPARSDPGAAERLGEALFFTTLMAPDVTSAERRSRFTCETCHFEGGTDGRVHHSGRGDVRVSTRPLLGLFNGAPYFSRAHDPDLTAVSHNEFRVANRGNPVDPWFALPTSRFSWLAELGVSEPALSPPALRRALLLFLARFTHAENPLAVRRTEPRRFTHEERHGARVFRERCLRCHAARLIAREAESEVPFERWEALVLSPEGPIVWSNGEYAKTRAMPYVDPLGTRTPSLRRLYLKRPYLTNGSAPTLEALLASVRFTGADFSHAGGLARGGQSLSSDEQRALLAFLSIL
jgi:hypothetical protein